MGLPTPGADSKEGFDKRFSGDVLKIEVFGPKQPQLSDVDVPGLFHNLKIVRGLMKDYMEYYLGRHGCSRQPLQSRSFRLPREADKDGSRTVGVITKCDALQRGDEKEVLNIAQNTVEKLTHGWFLVKNRSTQDLKDGVTLQERDVEETAFFEATSPWNVLSKDRVGVEPLTRAAEGVRRASTGTFPAAPIVKKACYAVSKLVENGMNGIYLTESGPEDPTKLRWRIRTTKEEFARDFTKHGHKWAFKTAQNTEDAEFEEDDSSDDEEYEESENTEPVHKETKGVELQGTVHPHLITVVFRQQSEPWEELSTTHLSDVKDIVEQYFKATFRKVVKELSVLQNLEWFLRPRILEGHFKADEELRKLLEDERGGILQTVNHYLAETLAKIRSDQEIQRLKKAGYEEGNEYIMRIEDLHTTRNISNDESAVYDTHDIVKSYYKVAMKRFLDNVII
ncbi:interferon-induced GTP-binding protein [Talaromyces pinophilus]|uniref:Interferon-induced GTP-binding protein n=1 Tax=Talaromyces pinophilus TaxID=128442 RepID=A0A0B8N082_TALPI|nr:interferon-induced GTP-binding protein [Talaromyces pinophilus]